MSRMQRRRGYALIEMVLIIASLSMVMGLAAVTLHALFRLDAAGRAAASDAQAVSLLASHFRDDAHASQSVQAENDSTLRFLINDEESIRYRFEKNQLHREALRNGQVRNRERYSMRRLGPVKFQVEDSFVAVSLARSAKEGFGKPVPYRIEARLGKDRLALKEATR